jgi:serine/threonine protein kinase
MTRPEPGLEFLPRLVLLRPLGRGGMGEVWVARDEVRGEEVVAKILPADAPAERVALLRREARLVRKVQHPAIVPVHGFAEGRHGSAVLLRYMRGGDASRLRGAPPLDVVRRVREIAGALEHLHGLGVVHRDVKPSNVLLDEEGRAHLADFGIASVSSPEDDEGLVLRGGGSRSSMSPQQRSGEPAQPGDDVYALGCLTYELLAGRPPLRAEATEEEIRAGPPPLAPTRDIPESLRQLVRSMLAPDPAERPRDMRALDAALRAVEAELAPSSPSGRGPDVRLQPPPRVPEFLLSPPGVAAGEPAGRARPLASSLSLPRIALFTSLGLAVLFVVMVLPRLAPAPRPEAGPPPPTLAEAQPPAPSPDPPPPLPAEASPPPSEATRRPAPTRPPASSRRYRPEETEASRPPAGPQRPDDEAARRAQEEFETAMSEAYAAVDREDWSAARQAFARAGALRPGSPAVADGLHRVDEGERASGLARHLAAARVLEAREDWLEAAGEYEEALKLDPTVAFAVEGHRRAAARALLAEKLEYHERHPERLGTEAVAREVETLLEEARETDPAGPRLRQQIADLERALADAETPVGVVIESDGRTDVVVYKVGRLGAFARKLLELRPGTYAVLGTRTGYRDVRLELVVKPHATPDPLVVRCEEPI